jgi:hypothetical protein
MDDFVTVPMFFLAVVALVGMLCAYYEGKERGRQDYIDDMDPRED